MTMTGNGTTTRVGRARTRTDRWDRERLAALEAEIVTVGAELGRARVRLLALTGDADASGAWAATGAVSCAHWLADLLDLEVSTTREHVRVARTLRQLHHTQAAFAGGQISYAKVRHLTRIATPDNETDLLPIAQTCTAGELPDALARWQHRHDPDGAGKRRRRERGVTIRRDPSGLTVITIRVDPDIAHRLEAHLDQLILQTPTPRTDGDGSQSEPRATLAQRRADAFSELVHRLDHPSPNASADATGPTTRPEFIYHRRVGETQLPDGTPLPPAVARLLSCDADIRVLTLGPDHTPADAGRRHRLVPPALRRLVLERDHHRCQFPGCRTRKFLTIHHLIHWEHGGPTDLWNLLTLCTHHHHWVHHHGWTTGQPATVRKAHARWQRQQRHRPDASADAPPANETGSAAEREHRVAA